MLASVTVAVLLVGAASCGGQSPGVGAAPRAQELAGAGLAFDPATGGVIAFGGTVRTTRETGPAATTWIWTGHGGT